MSARSSTSSHREELMFLGTECHHPSCHLHDFLPFNCPACHQSFCQPHFLPSQHACTAPLPPSMVDRIAPQCPMCNEVVPYPPGKLDPNEAVERHITAGTCTSMEGGEARKKAELRRRKDKGEVCYRRGCTKVLVVAMKCETCSRSFCPTHRHSTSHTCTPTSTPGASRTTTPAAGTRPGAKTAFSRLLQTSSASSSGSRSATSATSSSKSQPKPQPVKAQAQARASVSASAASAGQQIEAKTAAAAAALKRSGAEVKVPFVKTKTEKRANDELQSQIKALKARHDKGLLTKTEEVRYAELVGKTEGRRRAGEKDKDCIIA